MSPSTLRPFVILALSIAAGTASAQTPLAWNLKKGDVLKYDFVQKNDIKVVINGEPRSTVSDLDLDLTWTVSDVKDGVATIVQTIDKAKIGVQAPNATVKYESGSKANEEAAKEIARIYDAVIGEKYTLTLSKQGEVLNAEVPQKVVETLKDSPFAAYADSGSVFSAKGLRLMMNQVLPRLSDKPVSVGDKWKSSLEVPGGPIQLKLDTEFKLTGKPDAAPAIEGTIVTSVTPMPPLTVELKKHQGTIKSEFDKAKGAMTSTTVKHSIDMDLSVTGQKLSQTIVIEATMKLVK